jgi:cytochrome c oxidase subunit 2
MTAARALQSVLDPVSPQSLSISHLWWFVFAIAAAVFVSVLGMFAAALMRGRSGPTAERGPSQQTLMRVVSGAVAITVMTLFAILGASIWTGRIAASSPRDMSALAVSIVGHQWWWEIEYEDTTPSQHVTTANQLHLPIGRPVVFKVTSRDVIHSFWAPNFFGKRDLIPGYVTAIWFQADRAGVYRGQCAEFCGRQHAHMAFDIVAEPEADFERWRDAERQQAREPQSADERRGREIFMTTRCIGCHRIRGTDAGGQVGPDLTHVASRLMIGAGTLPNTGDQLARWIVNPHETKPGIQMPPNVLGGDDLRALVAYLESLR